MPYDIIGHHPTSASRQPSSPHIRLTHPIDMLLSVAALALSAAAATANHVDAVPVPATSNAIRVSTALNDDVWRLATPADEFHQREPREGEPSQRTEFRVAYDA